MFMVFDYLYCVAWCVEVFVMMKQCICGVNLNYHFYQIFYEYELFIVYPLICLRLSFIL